MVIQIVLSDSSVMQSDNTVGHLAERIIVSHHDDCVAVFLIYSLNEREYVLGCVVIQCSWRSAAAVHRRAG